MTVRAGKLFVGSKKTLTVRKFLSGYAIYYGGVFVHPITKSEYVRLSRGRKEKA